MIGAIPLLARFGLIAAGLMPITDRQTVPLDVADIAAPSFNVYTAEDGLSDEIWNSIGFDERGFVWAGSASSIARFDGRRWLNQPPRRPIGLVRDLLPNTDSGLWAIFEREGLARYHNQQWELGGERRYYFGFSESLRTDGGVDHWLTLERGLLSLRGERWIEDPANPMLTEGRTTAVEQTQTLFGEARQWLGLSEADSGLLFRRVEAGSAPGPWIKFNAPELRSVDITDLLRTHDRNGEALWIVSYGDGILRVREDGIRVWRAATGELPTEAIYDAVATSEGNDQATVWASSRAGLLRIRGDQIITYDRRHGLPSDAIRDVKVQRVDGRNVLWLATEGGIARAVLTQSQWQTVSLHGARENGIFGLLIEPDGRGGERLWAGSATEGLALLQQGQWRSYTQTPDGLALLNIRQIRRLPGPEGTDWRLLSLYGGALLRIDDQLNFRSMAVPWPKDSEEAVAGMHARTGKFGRELWFGMMKRGVYRLRGHDWQHFDAPSGLPTWRVFGFADQVDPQRQSWLWAATDQGLARFDGENWNLLPDSFGLREGLRGLALIQGVEGDELWLGSILRGTVRLDVSDPLAPKLLTDARVPPAPDAVVYSILRDSQGRIYVCTNNGIQQLTPKANGSYSEQVFRRKDGLIHDECNTNSQLIDASDRYWAGTLGGLGMFDPRTPTSLGASSRKPLRLTEIRIDGQPLPPPYPEQLSIPAGNSEIRVEFSLLSGMRESESRYRTWLRGDESAPAEWSNESVRALNRLRPGDYELQIEAVDYDGKSATPLTLKLSVQAYWWQSAWAQVFVVLLGLLAVGIAVLIYNRRLRARQRELKRLVASRTTELNAANQKLTQLSYQDALTGVANRRRLTEAMDAAIAWAVEHRKSIGLILVDVDHFKQYNDHFGHLAGDVALGAVAQALRSAVREQDLVARFGGEEFACLLLDADLATVTQIAERMRLLVQALPPRTIGNDQQTLTISAGVLNTVPTRTKESTDLLQAVDMALYQAKADGRNCIRHATLPGD